MLLEIEGDKVYFMSWTAEVSCMNTRRLREEVILKNRLEEIRKQREIKQEELAEAMGVSRQTISSLENGRYNPSVILAIKLARYFGMHVEDIFIYEEGQDEK